MLTMTLPLTDGPFRNQKEMGITLMERIVKKSLHVPMDDTLSIGPKHLDVSLTWWQSEMVKLAKSEGKALRAVLASKWESSNARAEIRKLTRTPNGTYHDRYWFHYLSQKDGEDSRYYVRISW